MKNTKQMIFNITVKQKAVVIMLLLAILLTPIATKAQTPVFQPRTEQELIAYLHGIVKQLQAQLAELQAAEARGETHRITRTTPNPFFVNVVSMAPTSVDRERATLRGEVDKGGSEYLDVWFQYGVGNNLNRQANLSPVTREGRQAVSVQIDDLRDNTMYSFRLVAEDERGNRHLGQVRTFTTIAPASVQTFSGRPTAETEGSTNIQAAAATVNGFVSMNDYGVGNVFFVFGTSRSAVANATDYDSFREIPVSAGVIMKRSVNAKFTGRNSVRIGLSSLRRATQYHYRVCVEYSERDDGVNPALRCGQIESFTTLN